MSEWRHQWVRVGIGMDFSEPPKVINSGGINARWKCDTFEQSRHYCSQTSLKPIASAIRALKISEQKQWWSDSVRLYSICWHLTRVNILTKKYRFFSFSSLLTLGSNVGLTFTSVESSLRYYTKLNDWLNDEYLVFRLLRDFYLLFDFCLLLL